MADTWLIRNIKQERISRGMSQKALAGQMADLGFKFEQQTIGRIEKAQRTVSGGEALAFARLFGRELNDLFQAPDVTKHQADLRHKTRNLQETEAYASGAMIAHQVASEELGALVADLRAGPHAAALAEDLEAAEKALKGGRA